MEALICINTNNNPTLRGMIGGILNRNRIKIFGTTAQIVVGKLLLIKRSSKPSIIAGVRGKKQAIK